MTKPILTIACWLLLFSCGHQTKKDQLVSQQIGNSNYFISVPVSYKLTQESGPDFSVYYFRPADKTDTLSFAGGFYFGDFSSLFEPENNLCDTAVVQGKILDTVHEWMQYSCDKKYLIQVIINIGDRTKMHAFGESNSRDDVNKLLAIFSTLIQKKK
jgi:hypothetical protein